MISFVANPLLEILTYLVWLPYFYSLKGFIIDAPSLVKMKKDEIMKSPIFSSLILSDSGF
jgi:hypothetical protein